GKSGPQLSAAACVLRNKPRLPWRESMLDCCRHMPSVEYIERHLDLMALLGLNRFHWHLTEDQGWRIQIDRFPRLTEVAAWRNGADGRLYGGCYTKEEVSRVVRSAAERCIEVVPEIEMPGHSMAALAAYPELGCTGGPYEVGTAWGIYEDIYCAGNDAVFEFLFGVLEEVLELFPFERVHIGGDEAPKARWQQCPKCQARIRAEGLKDEFELQSWFIRRVEGWLAERGRRLIGWDEIHEGGLPPTATVQWWRGWMKDVALEAARLGHEIVSTPTSHCYLDYGYEEYSVQHTYGFEPVPEELDADAAAKVLGGGGNMWTEHTPTEADMDRQIWPRMAAIAECLWTPAPLKSWPDFEARLQSFQSLLEELNVRYGPWG
ncbi:MAG: family 20 glycosylhydrolase, partial [Fimbriimonadales bacterium]|nr:family 20 glycosylhydrolase [Fimbriimonadales bacterium]